MKRNSIWLRAASLGLCVLLSGSMLFARLTAYTEENPCHYIPLTRSGGITTVRAADRLYVPGRMPLLSASWFRVKDHEGVWKGETQIEIFKFSYENGEAQVTVESSDKNKVIAPGTENTYKFSLENTGNESVSYEMTMEAWFSNEEYAIPVVAKVSDYKGNYLCGSEEEFADVLELNDVATSGKLSRGKVAPYTLQWQWPFEGDDEFDTFLGNLAEDEELTLTIVINTIASYTPSASGGLPKTGDDSHIQLMFTVMVASAAGLVWMFLVYRREEKENEKT